jgi:2-polyprenyl-3-methyl-5-hydroxy-6-metoxy-1,4-benzoquinol methylase
MNKNTMDFDEYFKYRNVEPHLYKDYVLPEYLQNVLPTDKKERIIDIGCGLGQTLLALKMLGYINLKGIDISPYAVDQCRAQNLDVSRSKNIVSFCHANKERYDFIVMSHVLEHIEKSEIINTLKAIHTKLLSKNGRLCIMVPNAQSNTDCYWAYEDFTHSLLFTAGSLFYVLKSAGFEHVKFLDMDGLEGVGAYARILKSVLLKGYRINKYFWNRVTSSSYHPPSPQIFTYEIKALATK